MAPFTTNSFAIQPEVEVTRTGSRIPSHLTVDYLINKFTELSGVLDSNLHMEWCKLDMVVSDHSELQMFMIQEKDFQN